MLSSHADFIIAIKGYLNGASVSWLFGGDTYDGLVWPDDASVPMPTEDQLETAYIPAAQRVSILSQIFDLENTITDRRIREAILQIDSGWLANVNTEIANLRSQL